MWSGTQMEHLKGFLSAPAGQGSSALFAPFLLYQSVCCRTVHFPFLSLHHPPPKPKHLKAQFEQWNVWYILVLSDGTMSVPWGVAEVILY